MRREFDSVAAKYRDNPKIRRKVTQRSTSDVIHALAGLVSIPARFEPPLILSRPTSTHRLFVVSNGVLDVDEALNGNAKAIKPHSPDLFNLTSSGYAYDQNATCPLWLQFLDRVMEGDALRIALCQEIFGLMLVFDTSFQKFFILIGEGANGKGVWCSVLTDLVGRDNVSHVPLSAFGARFQLANTLGKLINVEPDAGEITRAGESFIKSFTAGDRMSFEAKYKMPASALPTARVIVGTNAMPNFEDRSSGIWRRMTILPFNVQIPPAERDRKLAEKLKTELPGILNWSLEGLRRLYAQGHFTEPPICIESLDQYREQSNSARLFLNENYVISETESDECAKVYMRYKTFCERNGYERLSEAQFGVEVRRVFPKVERKRDTTGQRRYRYLGMQFVGLDAEAFGIIA